MEIIMYKISFQNPVSVYFVGIGGISMSGLAEILADAGFKVSGSDRSESEITDALEAKGIKVFYEQKEENITPDLDLVVFTAAIHPDNPEYIATQRLGIPSLSRAELLGQIMTNYRTPVAISGTHGKTTTTSMISEILMGADTDPTISIGGMLPSIGGNIRVGGPDYFVAEACEYTNSFLHFFPRISVILNVETDHMDFFKDLADVRSSFRRFAQLVPADGALVINADIPDYRELTESLTCKVITYGTSRLDSYGDPVDYYPENITYDKLGHATFTARGSQADLEITLKVPGAHNVSNALASLAVSDFAGLDRKSAAASLNRFTGTDRRFQYKGEWNGVTVIDDYAHHPTEIEATLRAAQRCEHKTLWVAFQPHTYTRTKAFLHEFAQALSLADKVVLADVYAAREKDEYGVNSSTLYAEMQKLGTDVHYYHSFEEIEEFLRKSCIKGDLLITMGAGDIYKIGESLLRS